MIPNPLGTSKLLLSAGVGNTSVPLPQGHCGIPTSFKGLCIYVCVFPFYMCPGNHKQIQVSKKRKKNGLQLKHPFCLQIIRDVNVFSISGSPKHPFHVKNPHYSIFDNSKILKRILEIRTPPTHATSKFTVNNAYTSMGLLSINLQRNKGVKTWTQILITPCRK